MIADCPEKEEKRNDTISEEEETDKEESSSDEEEEDDQKKEDLPFAVSQDISNISDGTTDFEEVPEAGNNIVTQSNTSNPAWATQSFFAKRKRKFPTTNVNVPGHWKTRCQENPKVTKEVKEYLANATELTPEAVRELCKHKDSIFSAQLSPNLKLLTDDPNAADFDWDAIFLPPDSFLSNNTI